MFPFKLPAAHYLQRYLFNLKKILIIMQFMYKVIKYWNIFKHVCVRYDDQFL